MPLAKALRFFRFPCNNNLMEWTGNETIQKKRRKALALMPEKFRRMKSILFRVRYFVLSGLALPVEMLSL